MSENELASLEKPENSEQKIYEEIWNFLEKNRYTLREIKEAWIIFTNSTKRDKEPGNEDLEEGRVGEIVQKLRGIDQNDFSIDKLRELFEKRKEAVKINEKIIEKIIEEYLQFIKGLGMTEEEEENLCLIAKGKKGKLIILSDGEIISKEIETPNKENLTSGLSFLLKFMKKVIKTGKEKGKEYKFAFRKEGEEEK